MNLTDLSYKIISINDGIPTVYFNCDGSEQNLASCPMEDATSTQAYLDQYVKDYIGGLQLTQFTVPEDVTSLVNQTITPQA